jgi:hypothetical protein
MPVWIADFLWDAHISNKGSFALQFLPRRNGKEVYDAVRAMNPNARVLFMSGYTAEIIRRRGMLDEDVHFLSKPVSLGTAFPHCPSPPYQRGIEGDCFGYPVLFFTLFFTLF